MDPRKLNLQEQMALRIIKEKISTFSLNFLLIAKALLDAEISNRNEKKK